MKKSFIIFFTLLAAGCGVPKDMFVIDGKVSEVKDSTMLVLYKSEGSMLKTLDTAYVVSGKFTFNYPIREHEKLAIIARSDDMPGMVLDIWAAPGMKASVRGENQLIYTWSVKSRIPEQRESEYYKQDLKKEWEEAQLIDLKLDKLSSELKAAPQDRRQSIIQEGRQLKSREDTLKYTIYDRKLDLLADKEPSEIFIDQLDGVCMMIRHYDIYAGLRERAIEQYNRLTEDMKNSPDGREIKTALFPPVLVNTGDPIPDAEFPGLDGKSHKLSDYKGKYILLDFWSAGCGPCLMAMPELREAAELYKDKLTIVGITSDPESLWRETSLKYNVTWVNLNVSSDPEFDARFGVNGIPHQVIVSPEGIVLGSWTGYGTGHIKKQLSEYIK